MGEWEMMVGYFTLEVNGTVTCNRHLCGILYTIHQEVKPTKAMDDKELERLAQEELLQEAKRAKSRAEEVGAVGWQRCPLPATNKRFLHNVLVSTLEPRKKKSRQTVKEPCETKEKIQSWKPVHKERQHKNPTKDKEKPSKKGHKHKQKAINT